MPVPAAPRRGGLFPHFRESLPMRLLLRSLPLLVLLVPACADRAPAPTAATAPPPAAVAAVEPSNTPAVPDNVAPYPRPAVPNWLDGSLAQNGRNQFLKYQCINCHTGAAGAKGPNLEGLYGSVVKLRGGEQTGADDAYLVESIRNPKAKVVEGWEPIMPAYDETQAPAEEVNALVAYIKSLRAVRTKPKGDVFPPPVGAPTGK